MSKELSPEALASLQKSFLHYGKEDFRDRYVQAPAKEDGGISRTALMIPIEQFGLTIGESWREALNLYVNSSSQVRYQSDSRPPIEDILLAGVSDYIQASRYGINVPGPFRFTEAEADSILGQIREKTALGGEQTITFSMASFKNGAPITMPLRESLRYLAGYDDGELFSRIAATCRNPTKPAGFTKEKQELCNDLESKLSLGENITRTCGDALRNAAVTEAQAQAPQAVFYVGMVDGTRGKVTPQDVSEVSILDAQNCVNPAPQASLPKAPAKPTEATGPLIASTTKPQR